MERANAHPTILPKTYCFSTQFMLSKLRNQWKKNINFLDFDLILFPIHLITSKHWVLAAAFPKQKQIIYFDSLGGTGSKYCQTISNFFKVRYPQEDMSKWNLSNSNNIPRQTNGIDCGVFVCQMAERLSRRAPFDFNQEQMPAIRIKMLEQLVAGPFPLPPSNQEVALAPPQTPSNPVLATEQHPTRFDMSPSDRIKQLQDELRELRAKATTQEIELARVQVDSAVQLADAIQSIREQTLGENQRLQAELDEANRRLEQMNVLGSPQPIFEEFPDDLSDVSTANQSPISMSVDSSPVSSAFMYPDTPPPLYSPPHSSPADAPHRHQLNVRRRLFPKDHSDDDDEPPTRCRRLESLQTPVRTQDPHTFSPSSLSGQTPIGPPGRELVWVYPPVFPPPYQYTDSTPSNTDPTRSSIRVA